MAHCRVSYTDVQGIRHEVELSADSLFEAVAHAVSQFRKCQWIEALPAAAAEFRVEVYASQPCIHTVQLADVQNFAKNGTVKGPKGILRKQRIRDWLNA